MKTKRSAIAIAVLLALALSAFASAGASAADRAFLCEAVTSGATFSDAHCLTSKAGGTGFKHTLPPAGANAITATNEKTASGTTASSPAVLKGHIAGVELAVTCSTTHGHGVQVNTAVNVNITIKIEYSGCTVTLPASKGCKVAGGAITTKELKATTEGTTGTTFKYQPVTGSEFGTVPIEGCEKERPPKGNYVVEGSLEVPTSGATITANHAAITSQGNLLFGGTVAGVEGATTISSGISGVTLTP